LRDNDFMGLPATLHNFPTFVTGAPDAICGAASLTPAGPFRFARRRGRKTKPISPSETKRFAGHAVSHWNPYERRIRHFAELCVFKGLASVSFRRIHGLCVFNDLAPFFVSPRNPQRLLTDLAAQGARRRVSEAEFHYNRNIFTVFWICQDLVLPQR